MANLAGQKTFLEVQQQISDIVLRKSIATTSTAPSLVRLKQIINDAYSEVSAEVDWSWRFVDSYTFPTVAAQQTAYVMPDAAEEVIFMTIPANQQRLRYGAYSQWIANYPGKYTNMGNTKPWAYIESPEASNNALQYYLFPAADQVYTISIGYMKRITLLSGDTDIMICPPEFQDIVINRAICKCYQYLKDDTWMLYDDGPDGKSFAARRYTDMWIKNQSFADWVGTFRSAKIEQQLSSQADLNRQLFVPF